MAFGNLIDLKVFSPKSVNRSHLFKRQVIEITYTTNEAIHKGCLHPPSVLLKNTDV